MDEERREMEKRVDIQRKVLNDGLQKIKSLVIVDLGLVEFILENSQNARQVFSSNDYAWPLYNYLILSPLL